MASRFQRKTGEVLLHHEFGPVWDAGSRLLILGSFPSVKSREVQFYYGFPRNRFWKVMAALFGGEVPESTEEKKAFLHDRHIALWDVIESCRIHGSSDSSIRDVTPNDIRPILAGSKVGGRVFANGTKAWDLYRKYLLPLTGIEAAKLPSTSPANAQYSLEKLTKVWREVMMSAGAELPRDAE